MRFVFHKLCGAGNDFVAFDNRDQSFPDSGRAEVVRRLCDRRFGIGADGVLLIDPPPGKDGGGSLSFRMRYYNCDGSEGEACGNGARCIARLAHALEIAPAEHRFQTGAGTCAAEVGSDSVSLTLPPPRDLRTGIKIQDAGGFSGEVDFMNTGVPHAVAWLKSVEDIPVEKWGRALRHHRAFGPAGTNANFVAREGTSAFRIRTFERGIEGETLACGTGATAAALVANHRFGDEAPISMRTQSGIMLILEFDRQGDAYSHLKLKGEARIVFRGEVDLDRVGLSARAG